MKSICSVAFPGTMPVPECLRRARDAGFRGFEIQMAKQLTLESSEEDLRRIREAARETGITIAAIWPSGYVRSHPLNSPDPAVRARGAEIVRKALSFAVALDCAELLIVPGRVTAAIGYGETWERTTAQLRELVPFAEKARVTLGIENVQNKFLLSPLEMRAFIDQFQTPWVRSHFDVGNTMAFGYPQDWIAILGPRIQRVHLKDYKTGKYVPLTEGDVDWKQVMAAFVKTGYRGTLSPEVPHNPNDPDQLFKISRALDRILALA